MRIPSPVSPALYPYAASSFGTVPHIPRTAQNLQQSILPSMATAPSPLPSPGYSSSTVRIPQRGFPAQNLQQSTTLDAHIMHSPVTSHSSSQGTSFDAEEDEDDVDVLPAPPASLTSPVPTKPTKIKGTKPRSTRKKGPAKAADSADADIEILDNRENDGEKECRSWTDEARYRLVEYVCKCEEDLSLFKLKQTHHFDILARDHFNEASGLKKTAKQIKNCYYRLWGKYLACKSRDKHTGGGDGDEGTVTLKSSVIEDSQGVSKGYASFSAAVLDEFRLSELFELFDKVAHDHPSVAKACEATSSQASGDVSARFIQGKRKREDARDVMDTVSVGMEEATQMRKRANDCEDARFEFEKTQAAILKQAQDEATERERECHLKDMELKASELASKQNDTLVRNLHQIKELEGDSSLLAQLTVKRMKAEVVSILKPSEEEKEQLGL